jgi:hypothetical protein
VAGCVIQPAGIVFLYAERQSWLIRLVKENLTLLMDLLIVEAESLLDVYRGDLGMRNPAASRTTRR